MNPDAPQLAPCEGASQTEGLPLAPSTMADEIPEEVRARLHALDDLEAVRKFLKSVVRANGLEEVREAFGSIS